MIAIAAGRAWREAAALRRDLAVKCEVAVEMCEALRTGIYPPTPPAVCICTYKADNVALTALYRVYMYIYAYMYM